MLKLFLNEVVVDDFQTVITETYSQEVAFVLLDLVPDVLVEEELAEDERTHGLHVQTLCLCQDLLICPIDGSALLLLLFKNKEVNNCGERFVLVKSNNWSLDCSTRHCLGGFPLI